MSQKRRYAPTRRPTPVFVLCSGTALVWIVAFVFTPPLHTVLLGTLLILLLALVWGRDEGLEIGNMMLLDAPLALAKDEDVFDLYAQIANELRGISAHRDPILRELALQRTEEIASQIAQLAAGEVVFQDTETWRIVYEQLLRSTGLHLYRSVAMVYSPAYWQDEPGRRSMRLNYELLGAGTLRVERTIVLADELWPSNEHLPSVSLRHWINEQHHHGVVLRLVRLSSIINEVDLQADFGIYGTRAVGVQELDLHSKTVRFMLSFDFDRVREAEGRWERIAVYAASYGDLLDSPDFDL